MSAPDSIGLRRAKVELAQRIRADKPVSVACVHCSRPGCTQWLEFTQTGASPLPVDAVAKWTRARGWAWSDRGAHLCPDHQKKRKPEAKVKDDHDTQVTKIQTASTTQIPAPAPPREPTPADNRRVMEALDSAFDDKTGSYVDVGVTDGTLAAQLSVPRKWVEDVREKFFGPIKTDPEREKLIADLAALRSSVKAAVDKAMNAASEAEAELLKIDALADRFIKAGDKRRA